MYVCICALCSIRGSGERVIFCSTSISALGPQMKGCFCCERLTLSYDRHSAGDIWFGGRLFPLLFRYSISWALPSVVFREGGVGRVFCGRYTLLACVESNNKRLLSSTARRANHLDQRRERHSLPFPRARGVSEDVGNRVRRFRGCCLRVFISSRQKGADYLVIVHANNATLEAGRVSRCASGGREYNPSSVCVLCLLEEFAGTVDLRWVAVGEGWPSESAEPNR